MPIAFIQFMISASYKLCCATSIDRRQSKVQFKCMKKAKQKIKIRKSFTYELIKWNLWHEIEQKEEEEPEEK